MTWSKTLSFWSTCTYSFAIYADTQNIKGAVSDKHIRVSSSQSAARMHSVPASTCAGARQESRNPDQVDQCSPLSQTGTPTEPPTCTSISTPHFGFPVSPHCSKGRLYLVHDFIPVERGLADTAIKDHREWSAASLLHMDRHGLVLTIVVALDLDEGSRRWHRVPLLRGLDHVSTRHHQPNDRDSPLFASLKKETHYTHMRMNRRAPCGMHTTDASAATHPNDELHDLLELVSNHLFRHFSRRCRRCAATLRRWWRFLLRRKAPHEQRFRSAHAQRIAVALLDQVARTHGRTRRSSRCAHHHIQGHHHLCR